MNRLFVGSALMVCVLLAHVSHIVAQSTPAPLDDTPAPGDTTSSPGTPDPDSGTPEPTAVPPEGPKGPGPNGPPGGDDNTPSPFEQPKPPVHKNVTILRPNVEVDYNVTLRIENGKPVLFLSPPRTSVDGNEINAFSLTLTGALKSRGTFTEDVQTGVKCHAKSNKCVGFGETADGNTTVYLLHIRENEEPSITYTKFNISKFFGNQFAWRDADTIIGAFGTEPPSSHTVMYAVGLSGQNLTELARYPNTQPTTTTGHDFEALATETTRRPPMPFHSFQCEKDFCFFYEKETNEINKFYPYNTTMKNVTRLKLPPLPSKAAFVSVFPTKEGKSGYVVLSEPTFNEEGAFYDLHIVMHNATDGKLFARLLFKHKLTRGHRVEDLACYEELDGCIGPGTFDNKTLEINVFHLAPPEDDKRKDDDVDETPRPPGPPVHKNVTILRPNVEVNYNVTLRMENRKPTLFLSPPRTSVDGNEIQAYSLSLTGALKSRGAFTEDVQTGVKCHAKSNKCVGFGKNADGNTTVYIINVREEEGPNGNQQSNQNQPSITYTKFNISKFFGNEFAWRDDDTIIGAFGTEPPSTHAVMYAVGLSGQNLTELARYPNTQPTTTTGHDFEALATTETTRRPPMPFHSFQCEKDFCFFFDDRTDEINKFYPYNTTMKNVTKLKLPPLPSKAAFVSVFPTKEGKSGYVVLSEPTFNEEGAFYDMHFIMHNATDGKLFARLLFKHKLTRGHRVEDLACYEELDGCIGPGTFDNKTLEINVFHLAPPEDDKRKRHGRNVHGQAEVINTEVERSYNISYAGTSFRTGDQFFLSPPMKDGETLSYFNLFLEPIDATNRGNPKSSIDTGFKCNVENSGTTCVGFKKESNGKSRIFVVDPHRDGASIDVDDFELDFFPDEFEWHKKFVIAATNTAGAKPSVYKINLSSQKADKLFELTNPTKAPSATPTPTHAEDKEAFIELPKHFHSFSCSDRLDQCFFYDQGTAGALFFTPNNNAAQQQFRTAPKRHGHITALSAAHEGVVSLSAIRTVPGPNGEKYSEFNLTYILEDNSQKKLYTGPHHTYTVPHEIRPFDFFCYDTRGESTECVLSVSLDGEHLDFVKASLPGIPKQTPVPPPPCSECNDRGTAYFSSYSQKCYCSCNFPFGGTSCERCRNPRDTLINASCVTCVQNTFSTVVGVAGTKINYALQLASPTCHAGLQFYNTVYYPRWNQDLTVVDASGSPSTFEITLPDCPNTQYTGYLAAKKENSWFVLASMLCVQSFTFAVPADIPESFHFHFLDRMQWDLAALSFASGIWKKPGVTVRVSFFNAPTKVYSTSDTSFADFQVFMSAQFDDTKSSGCEHALTNIKTETSVSRAFILVGDLRGSCDTTQKASFNSDLAAIVVGGSAVFWMGLDVSAPNYVTAISYNIYVRDQMDALMAKMNTFVFLMKPPVILDNNFAPTPTTIGSIARTHFLLDGLRDITKCCVGPACSTFVGIENGRASCYTPFLTAGQYTVNATRRSDGKEIVSTQKMTVEWRYPTYYVWSSGTKRFYIYRRFSYYTRDVANAERCCSLVAVGFNDFNVMGFFNGTSFCFSTFYHTHNLIPDPVAGMFSAEVPPMSLALQCHRPKVAELHENAPELGSIIGSSVVTHTPQPSVTVSQNTRERYGTYIKHLLDNAKASAEGRSLKHVRQALSAAQLQSYYPRETFVCGANDVPAKDGKCYFPWSQKAMHAGVHLISAGFDELTTDWQLSNAVIGDIVVFPALEIYDFDKNARVAYPNGHIQVKHADGSADNKDWVSDYVHTKMPFNGVYQALNGETNGFLSTNLQLPKLYRLREDAPTPPQEEEEVMPVRGIENFVDDAETWMRKWAVEDAKLFDNATGLAYMNTYYQCPNRIELNVRNRFTFPRQLFRIFPTPTGASHCFRLWTSAILNTGLRCCYNPEGFYFDGYPSQLEFRVPWMNEWQRVLENTAEAISCAKNTTTVACAIYQQRRPAVQSTQSTFRAPSLWRPRRVSGGVFGDPHCTTYDNPSSTYECNYKGEAVWTGCNDWVVHAVASTIGTGRATVITGVGVRYKTDTVRLAISNTVRAVGTQGYDVFMNDNSISTNTAGTYLTVNIDGKTVTITDPDGNEVSATAENSFFALQTTPGDTCVGKTIGLCGNNNNVNGDDYIVKGTTTVVPATSTAQTIYTEFVLSWLITNSAESLWPQTEFATVQGDANFSPMFSSEALAGCPAACNNNPSCCVDAAVGGTTFATAFLAAVTSLNTANANTVKVGENWPPAFHTAPPKSGTDSGTLVFKSEDTDGTITGITCSVCIDGLATCRTSGVGTANAELTMTVTSLPEGLFTCTAVDNKGASAVSHTHASRTISNVVVNVNTPAPDQHGTSSIACNGGCIAGVVVGGVVGVSLIVAAGVFFMTKFNKPPTRVSNEPSCEDFKKDPENDPHQV